MARDFFAGGLGGGVAFGVNQGVEMAKDVVAVASSGMSEGAAISKAGPGLVAGARALAKAAGAHAVPEEKRKPNP